MDWKFLKFLSLVISDSLPADDNDLLSSSSVGMMNPVNNSTQLIFIESIYHHTYNKASNP
jgi:hypothetical protein